MNKRERGPIAPLSGLRPPGPPPDLKAAVLQAAGEAMIRPVPDHWTLLWRNPAARAAWALATALLLLGNLFVHLRTPSSGPAGGAIRVGAPGPELAEIAALPRINTDLIPFSGIPEENRRPSKPERRAPEGDGQEKEIRS